MTPVHHLSEAGAGAGVDAALEQIVPRRFARAPVIDGQVIGATAVMGTEALRDDLGRQLVGTVHEDGRVELAEPTNRRVFWTGWVR